MTGKGGSENISPVSVIFRQVFRTHIDIYRAYTSPVSNSPRKLSKEHGKFASEILMITKTALARVSVSAVV